MARGPDDLTELCLAFGAHMVVLGGQGGQLGGSGGAASREAGIGRGAGQVRSSSWPRKAAIPRSADDPALLPQAPLLVRSVAAQGRIRARHPGRGARHGGHAARRGAGRRRTPSSTMRSGSRCGRRSASTSASGETLAVLHVREGNADVLRSLTAASRRRIADRRRAAPPSPLLLSVVTDRRRDDGSVRKVDPDQAKRHPDFHRSAFSFFVWRILEYFYSVTVHIGMRF